MKQLLKLTIISTILITLSCQQNEVDNGEINSEEGTAEQLNDSYSDYENQDFIRLLEEGDDYEVNRDIATMESLCGDADFKNIYEYNGELGPSRDFVLKHSPSVGAICKSNTPGGAKYCSGTLISNDLFLTANHCIDKRSVGNYVAFNYQYKSKGNLDTQAFYKIIEIVEQGRKNKIDYAIVRLEGNPGERFGFAKTSLEEQSESEELTIIQHPRGRPKEIEAGDYKNISNKWILYTNLDTEPGSSGSGIIDSKGNLVGVHTNGGCKRNNTGANHGMNMITIAKYSSIIN